MVGLRYGFFPRVTGVISYQSGVDKYTKPPECVDIIRRTS